MKYQIKTFRDAGLEACWSKTRSGTPVIIVRDPNGPFTNERESWWIVTDGMFRSMKECGVKEGFENHTILGEFFSIVS